ncbi:MAG: hypothetical protein K5979_12230 [Ruminococcus sp.]|nr:hypothetical protein [Ruminococcus sp.]
MKNTSVKMRNIAAVFVSLMLSFVILFNDTTPCVHAWLCDTANIPIAVTGNIRRSYFESGDGTSAQQYAGSELSSDEGCAYEIKTPLQLYYFAWLQYLGFFNQPEGNTSAIDQVYFYLSADIDMAGYTLPPIGTTQYPFVGNFDGNGHTVSNLTVQNTESANSEFTEKPVDDVDYAEIIGFFGVVGSLNANGTVNGAVNQSGGFSATSGYTYSSSINEVKDFTINGVTVKTETDNALIGAIAGYVNGKVENAAAANTSLVVGDDTSPLTYTNKISDYSLVGYCTDAYKFMLNVSKVTLYAPEETQNIIYKTVQGEGPGFGGSVNMLNFYNRMKSTYNAGHWAEYTPNIERVYDINGDLVSETESGSAIDPYHNVYYAEKGGSYSFVKYDSTGETDNFYYVYGDTAYDKTVYTTTYTYVENNVFYISQNGNYLSLDENGYIINTDTPVTLWIIDENGSIFTARDYSTTYQTHYYLNYDGESGLTVGVDTPNNTQWQKGDNIQYKNMYCIQFNGNEWAVSPYSIRIKSSDGHYLNINNNGAISTGNTVETATQWLYNQYGYLSTVVNGTTYYLYNNSGTLTASNTRTTNWNIDTENVRISNNQYYLLYNNNTWSLYNYTRSYYITDGKGNYLSYNGTLTNTNQANATKWTFSNNGDNPSGKISAVYNGTPYYLRYNSGLTTTTSNRSATSWSNDGNSLYNSSNYIYFSNGKWIASQLPTETGYTISYNGKYLNATSTSAVGTGTSASDYTDANGNTIWIFSNTETTPDDTTSTTIYTYINGTKYYLNRNYTSLRVATSSTNWQYSYGRTRIYTSYNNAYYYVKLNGSSFILSNEDRGHVFDRTEQEILISYGIPKLVIPDVTGIDNTIEDAMPYLNYDVATENVITPHTDETTENFPTGLNATYFPINAVGNDTFNNNFVTLDDTNKNLLEPADTNTGYVVSGNQLGSQTTYGYEGAGDIRISKYAVGSYNRSANSTTGIYNSISNSTSSNTISQYTSTYDSQLEIITAVNHDSYSGFYRVSDEKNESNNVINTQISNTVANNRKINYNTLGLKRYKDARDELSNMLLGKENIYGLHFMDASINKDNYVTISEANINGETIYDYKVPCDCIDFNVKRRGFITVFAGSYFPTNNAFFSLHRIFRDEDNEITDIKEISKIYKASGSNDYIYQYRDNNYSSDAARGDMVFDMDWMTNPSVMIMNAVYYFEIPVNGGEFALGSVSGKDGAYLFYLDIAANANTAEDKVRVTVAEKIKEESYSVELPRGVQLAESGNGYDTSYPYEFPAIALDNGYSGTYPLVRTGNNISYTDDENSELIYIGGTLTAQTQNGQNILTYEYYPDGYTIRYIEHITDRGDSTGNYDHFIIETTDTYDQSGTRAALRTVKVYADIDNLETNETLDESTLDLIVTFTYDPTGHDNVATRVVRAVSEGGFNISFDQNLTLISVSITDANVHINFGDNLASVLITASQAQPLPANYQIPAVDFTGNTEIEHTYNGSVYSDAPIAYYFNYFEGSGENAEVDYSTSVTMPMLDAGTNAQSRSLDYDITLTAGSGVSELKVYGRKLTDSYTYITKVSGGNMNTVDSGTVTVNIDSITINNTSLGSLNTEILVS